MQTLGLVSISFRSLSPEELLCLCREAGLSSIEWGSDVHVKPEDQENLQAVLALEKEHGISCSSYGTYFKLGVHSLDTLPSYIETAKALKTDILRIWGGGKDFEKMSEEERKALLEEAKKAALIAEKSGVTLCLECHNGTVTSCLDGAKFIIEGTSSKALQMYWQPNQYKSLEENLAYAEWAAPYTKVIHVFNWRENLRFPLGEAVGLWKRYLGYFDGTQTLLLEFMPKNEPDELKEEAKALFEIVS